MKKLLTISLILLTSCSLVPEYKRPETAAPANWSQPVNTQAAEVTKEWWKKYNNTELNNLITSALNNNKDLEAGIARIEQARGASKVAGSSLLPSVDASAGTSAKRANSRGGGNREGYDAGIDIGYEIDLFGRNRAGADAAKTRELATIYDYDALVLVVASDTASYYAQYLSLNDRTTIAEKNLENGRKILKIVQAKYDEGRISALELSQQKASLANLESNIANLKNQRDVAKSQLAILTGVPPQNLAVTGKSVSEITVPSVKPIQPGELLTRRPDIKAAEENLKAANIDIGAAKADFYPNLQIGLTPGLAASGFGDPVSLVATLFAAITQPIFSGGSLEGNLEQTEARKKELAANYIGLVLRSYKEVEDALSGVNSAHERLKAGTTSVTESRRAYEIANIRYNEGKTDFQTLLDTQNALFQAEDNFYQANLASVDSTITLYKSLGGGWQEAQ